MKTKDNETFWFYTLLLISILTSSLVFKTIYFIYEIGLSPHKKYILLSSFGLSLIILSLLILKRSKLNFIIVGIFYTLIDLLIYADIVYERYYDSILHIELFAQANQLGNITDSILSLMNISDIIYWLDLPLFLIGLFIYNKKIDGKKRPTLFSVVLSLGLTILIFTSFYPLNESYSDQYMVALTGFVPAHIYTTSKTIHMNIIDSKFNKDHSEIIKEIRSRAEKNLELQKSSPLFGKYKGKNLIIVQAESLNTFPIGMKINGQEITPNINKLIEVSYYFPNAYLQIGRGNTSDAEFVANNSLYPMSSKGIYTEYPKNDFLSLATILKEEGYTTSATHGYLPDFWNRMEAYPNQGFQEFYYINHPAINREKIIGMGVSDESMFIQMIPFYKKDQPFYNFFVTLTNHRPFVLPEELQYLELPEEFQNTNTGNYLQSVHLFDHALGKFIKHLKDEKIWEETIFILYGDHYGLLPKDEQELKKLLGITFDEKTRFNIPLIIHLPNQDKGVINEVITSQMDIYPTVTMLLGINRPLIQMGVPLNIKHEGFAGFAYETTRYTFYSDRYDYIASHDGQFESGTCIDNITNKATDVYACKKIYDKLVRDIEISEFLLKNNLIKEIFKK